MPIYSNILSRQMNESNQKVINIDPDLFSNTASTRRKRNGDSSRPVKEKKQPVNALKKSIIKMIRQHQQDKIKQEIKNQLAINKEGSNKKGDKEPNDDEAVVENINRLLTLLPDTEADENTEFAESMDFLGKLSESIKTKTNNNDPKIQFQPTTTPVLFSQPSVPMQPMPMPMQPSVPVSRQPIPVYRTSINSALNHPNTPPVYGVLRQGNLPTYRDLSRTVRAAPNPKVLPMSEEQRARIQWLETQIKKASLERQIDKVNRLYAEAHTPARAGTASVAGTIGASVGAGSVGAGSVGAGSSKEERDKKGVTKFMHIPKQKRIVKRTYRVGKKPTQNKLGVLLPNKTIRSQITLKQVQARQTPMPEVRKYLIRHGFIQIGSIAPSNVLRQLYETAKSFTGEIVNHSEDELVKRDHHK